MTTRTKEDEVLVATETFAFGDDVFFEGKTRVVSDHPAVKANPARFVPVEVTPTIGHVEEATAAPGRKRGQA